MCITKIKITDCECVRLSLVAEHKPNGSCVLRIYPIKHVKKDMIGVPAGCYKNRKPLMKIKFENTGALQTFVEVLDTMMETQVNRENAQSGSVPEKLARFLTNKVSEMIKATEELSDFNESFRKRNQELVDENNRLKKEKVKED